MKDAHSISTRRAYGVQRVCRVWHRARCKYPPAKPGALVCEPLKAA